MGFSSFSVAMESDTTRRPTNLNLLTMILHSISHTSIAPHMQQDMSQNFVDLTHKLALCLSRLRISCKIFSRTFRAVRTDVVVSSRFCNFDYYLLQRFPKVMDPELDSNDEYLWMLLTNEHLLSNFHASNTLRT